ncbi:hypothetical protein SLS58_004228 [Diplodia intermedia]|uniref:Uncharacterized protein n=1 Tax=Diplodia intermedia TaxID=856260 RepID=A0ABR3TV84_9PEZI
MMKLHLSILKSEHRDFDDVWTDQFDAHPKNLLDKLAMMVILSEDGEEVVAQPVLRTHTYSTQRSHPGLFLQVKDIQIKIAPE